MEKDRGKLVESLGKDWENVVEKLVRERSRY
jgi:hypothetical protein